MTFTPEGESPGQPAWSPDGERIAYPRFAPAGQEGIWIIGAAGGGAARIAGTQLLDDDPTWSPDGTRIAFNGRGRTPAGIYVVDADGGTPALIPGTNGYQDPSWSPDGRLIAASTGGAQPDIVVFAPDGQDKARADRQRDDRGVLARLVPGRHAHRLRQQPPDPGRDGHAHAPVDHGRRRLGRDPVHRAVRNQHHGHDRPGRAPGLVARRHRRSPSPAATRTAAGS